MAVRFAISRPPGSVNCERPQSQIPVRLEGRPATAGKVTGDLDLYGPERGHRLRFSDLVAVVTDLMPPYRRPLFRELARRLDLTVLLTSRGKEWYSPRTPEAGDYGFEIRPAGPGLK